MSFREPDICVTCNEEKRRPIDQVYSLRCESLGHLNLKDETLEQSISRRNRRMIMAPILSNDQMKEINGWVDRSNGTMELVEAISKVQHAKTLEWACDWIEEHPGESLKDYVESAGVKLFKETLEEVLSI